MSTLDEFPQVGQRDHVGMAATDQQESFAHCIAPH